jgi:formate--tetrahydrofolate ligase
MTHDQEVARGVTLQPIAAVAERAGIPASALEPYGRKMAKLGLDYVRSVQSNPDGRLVLVTGISPTAAGEGKTTTTVGLGDALCASGTRTIICLREPSLGPCFGMKGGAAGGGRAQVAPMEEINLHFTGDFHAITSANNLLAAMLDNHIYWGNALGIEARRITWRRCLDMNDRQLRDIVQGLDGAVREDGFDITVASEVMAVFCLARDLPDLQDRLGRMVVATRRDGSEITARDLKADGPMAALLKDAFMPNLVQTLEANPALVHGGPFANIAHGCNSVMATRLALKLADVVVTEAGFGADLGAEKFFDIKCRQAGITPSAVVVVATVRALKMHGGVAKGALGREDIEAVTRGLVNLERHVENMQGFGLPVVVCVNHFTSDTEGELAAIRDGMARHGVKVVVCTHWADGSKGTLALADAVREMLDAGTAHFAPLYPDDMKLADKLRTIAQKMYRASDIALTPAIAKRFEAIEKAGHGQLQVCVAKTQYSFSSDPTELGAPSGHVLPVREVRLSAGAGFVVAVCGEIMTMPGLPKVPSAEGIGLDAEGLIEGLF